MVLSDTSGCLRVSPKSHLLFEAIMGCMGFQDPGSVYDFVPLRPSLYDRVATVRAVDTGSHGARCGGRGSVGQRAGGVRASGSRVTQSATGSVRARG